jgi:protein disulfide-isomerase A6
VRPGKKAGRPAVEDYQGPRTAKGIVDVVVDKINNHVKKVTDKDLDDWLAKNNDSAKALLFTEKGTTSALLKGVAIDFLDVIQVAQVRNKEDKAVETFGIESFPSLVLLPGGEQPALLYDGEMKKEGIVKFLSQAGAPNQDPPAQKPKAKKEKKDKSKEAKSKATTDDESAETESAEIPVETTKAAVVVPPIPVITDSAKLTEECLNSKSGTCILALVPSAHSGISERILKDLSEVAFKHSHRRLFPIFEVHIEDEAIASLAKELGLTGEVEVIAVNGKRGWWRRFEDGLVDYWIDTIRMSEGEKKKIPEGVITSVVSKKPAEETPASEKPVKETIEVTVEDEIKIEIPDSDESTSWQGAEPTPEATEAPESVHDEL